MRELLARLHDWLRRDRLDRELTEELRFHRDRLEREALDQGLQPDAARSAAARRLGNQLAIREQSRDRWSWPWLDRLQQDLRYAIRGLRRSPAFTVTVVATLGLGIGANAVMFGVIDRLMFRPMAYLRDPGQVHRAYLQWTDRGQLRTESGGYEYTTYLDIRRFSTAFGQLAGFANITMAVGSGEASREHRVATVSGEFFGFFDTQPALGRFFGPAEDVPPLGSPVAVLSWAYWQTEFGGRDILGQVLPIGNIPSTIIGVVPKGFVGIPDATPPVAYIPITSFAGNMGGPTDRSSYFTRYDWGWMSFMLRRNDGISVRTASADLSQAYRRSWIAAVALDQEGIPVDVGRPQGIAGPLRLAAGPTASLEARTLLYVTGVAGIVLLIASANVANLMFARVLRRRRETAVRLALGVSRRRLLAQSLTESLVLAGLGALAGLALAQWGGAAFRRLFVQTEPLGVLTDWRTIGVAGAVALLAGMLAGLGPALLATRADLAGQLKSGAREGATHRSRTRTGLLVFQGALSVILLVGAGLFVRSLRNVKGMRMGYDPAQVVVVGRNLRGMQLPDSERVALGHRLLEAAQAVPGVALAALASSVPFWSTSNRNLYVAGIDSVDRLGRFSYQTASPDYFAAMDTRIIRGRPFTAIDRGGSPRVAVVSEAMAAILWPGRDAIGQCFRIGADSAPCTTVIGIAENAVQRSLLGDERPYRYYMPIDQFEPARGNWLVLRVQGEPTHDLERIRKALQPIMPGESYVTATPLEQVIEPQRRSWNVGATMFVAFGGLALLVAAVGLYGVITYSVTQRMHELGVRIALGAQTKDVVRLVVGQGLRFAVVGVTLGLLVSLIVARWVQPLLFRQSARDPATYLVVAALLLFVALVASGMPARRAAKADPNAALRAE